MRTEFILCSIKEELYEIDKANLRMNGILMADNLVEALQPVTHGEINCLLITDRIIEEQSSLFEITENARILYNLYPKKIRIIYIKRGTENDILTELMDEFSNWDVYYNSQLSDFRTEDIVEMFDNKKVPERRKSDKLIKNEKVHIIKRANKMSRSILSEMTRDNDFENNANLKGIILNNLELVGDVVLGFEESKKDLTLLRNKLETKDITIEKLHEDLKELRQLNKDLLTIQKNLEANRSNMLTSIRELQGKYNTLVEQLTDIIDLTETNSRLAKTIDSDRFKKDQPLIFYIKEYTNVNYLTTYLQHFNDILNNVVGLSKTLVIENDLHTTRIPLYEEKNFVYVTDGTPMENIVIGNLITCGNNSKLLNYLIQNSLKLDVLIIYDRTGSAVDVVKGSNVIKFAGVFDTQDAKTLGIEDLNIITNDEKGKYVIPTIDNYSIIKNNEELSASVYSSIAITKKLVTFFREWDSIRLYEDKPYEAVNDDYSLTEIAEEI